MTLNTPVTLACGHHLIFEKGRSPVRGESVWCIGCRQYQTVRLAQPRYSVTCLNCRYAKGTFGHMRFTAENAIVSHLQRRPGHTVQLWDGQHLEDTFTSEPTQETLRSLLDKLRGEPPY